MCIGIPMRVLDPGPATALCERDGEVVRIDMRLVGEQPAGTWVLVFIDAAREVLSEREALRVRDALAALAAVAQGRPVDHLFADLVGREPQLPDFLQPRSEES
jgi:hydrogenase expression/formation protein HypC